MPEESNHNSPAEGILPDSRFREFALTSAFDAACRFFAAILMERRRKSVGFADVEEWQRKPLRQKWHVVPTYPIGED
jgi:hypothetical protein